MSGSMGTHHEKTFTNQRATHWNNSSKSITSQNDANETNDRALRTLNKEEHEEN